MTGPRKTQNGRKGIGNEEWECPYCGCISSEIETLMCIPVQRLFHTNLCLFCMCCLFWLTENVIFGGSIIIITFLTVTQLTYLKGIGEGDSRGSGSRGGGSRGSGSRGSGSLVLALQNLKITREMPSNVWVSLTEYSLFVLQFRLKMTPVLHAMYTYCM